MICIHTNDTSTFPDIEDSIYFGPVQNIKTFCNRVWYTNDTSTFPDIEDIHILLNAK